MRDLPEPLTPPDADLRDLKSMLVDVQRLRDSGLASINDAEAFRANVLLFFAAFHQVPAGSVPNDKAELSKLTGCGRDTRFFDKLVKAGALRNFVLCSDGRYYHTVVCEKVHEALEMREKFQKRTAAARAAKAAKQSPPDDGGSSPGGGTEAGASSSGGVVTPMRRKSASVTGSVCRSSVTTFDTATVTAFGKPLSQCLLQPLSEVKLSKEKLSKKEPPPLRSCPTAVDASVTEVRAGLAPASGVGFETFWFSYPKRVGIDAARRAWARACRRAAPAEILAGLACQRWPDNPRFIPNPVNWLRDGGWRDDPDARAGAPRMDAMERMRRDFDLPSLQFAVADDDVPEVLQ